MYLAWDKDCRREGVVSRESGSPYTLSIPLTLPFCLSNETNQKGARQWWFSAMAIHWNRQISSKKTLTPRTTWTNCSRICGKATRSECRCKATTFSKGTQTSVYIKYEGTSSSATTFLVTIIPGSKRPETEWLGSGRTYRRFTNWTLKWKGEQCRQLQEHHFIHD